MIERLAHASYWTLFLGGVVVAVLGSLHIIGSTPEAQAITFAVGMGMWAIGWVGRYVLLGRWLP
jgi:hypothetical protein